MTAYDITLKDRTLERIEGADAYQHEGQFTTFFRTRDERRLVDCWSVRVASYRSSELLAIKLVDQGT
jgi:hypothetical protein